LKFNGTADINLSAPTGGDYPGVLFFQDRNDTGYTHTINGSSTSTLQGAVYMPSSHVRMLGTGASAGGCLQLIADTIEFSGTSAFEHTCAGSGTNDALVVGSVALTL